MAASAVAADRDHTRPGAQVSPVLQRPSIRGVTVLHPRGRRVLWRQPIVHRKYVNAGTAADYSAQVVLGIKITDHPATPVDEHQQGADFIVVGKIMARRDR